MAISERTKRIHRNLFNEAVQGRGTPMLVRALFCNQIDQIIQVNKGIMFDDIEPDGFPMAPDKTARQVNKHFKVPEEYKHMTETQEKEFNKDRQRREYEGMGTQTALYYQEPRPDIDDTHALLKTQRQFVKSRRGWIRHAGLDFMFAPGMSQLTYRDLLKRPYPNWSTWIQGEIDRDQVATAGGHQLLGTGIVHHVR